MQLPAGAWPMQFMSGATDAGPGVTSQPVPPGLLWVVTNLTVVGTDAVTTSWTWFDTDSLAIFSSGAYDPIDLVTYQEEHFRVFTVGASISFAVLLGTGVNYGCSGYALTDDYEGGT